MKKTLLTLLTAVFILPLFCQESGELLTNTFTFRDGIYSTAGELRMNAPRYPDCRLDIAKSVPGYPMIRYYDPENAVHVYDDSCFAVVNSGILYVWNIQSFYKAYQLGAITLLRQTNWHSAFQTDSQTAMDAGCLLDFNAGKVMPLNFGKLSPILERDPGIAGEISGTKKSENKDRMFYYIAKYNKNHPVYVPATR